MAKTTAQKRQEGLRNRRAGKAAQLRAVTWLRSEEGGGYTSAEVTTGPHRGDMVTGVGDWNLEVTVEGWQGIGGKADQAAADAAALGYRNWLIWKPRRGVGDMGRAWCVTEFRLVWGMIREIHQLRHMVRQLAAVLNADSAAMLAAAGFDAERIRQIIGDDADG